jgi:hypothetical protein
MVIMLTGHGGVKTDTRLQSVSSRGASEQAATIEETSSPLTELPSKRIYWR